MVDYLNRNRLKDKNFTGSTLIELIIIVSILVVLILLILTVFRTQIFKGRDAKRKGDLHLIQEAVEEYEKDHDCYPPASLVVCHPGDGLKPYLDKIPCDPTTKDSYYYESEADNCPAWYRLFADLENTKDNDYVAGLGPQGAYSFVVSSPNAPAATPGPTPTPTAPGGATPTPSSPPGSSFWGCFEGQCKQISGPDDCNPNYQAEDCYGECLDPITGEPKNECTPG